MSIALAEPLWLLVVLLVLPMAVPLFRRGSPLLGAKRWVALAARAALLLVIGLLLADASSVRETDRLAVVVAIDASESVDRFASGVMDEEGGLVPHHAAVASFLRTIDQARGPDNLLGVVLFGGRSVAAATPSEARLEGRSFDQTLPNGTDLASAIRLGAAMIPPDAAGRLVIVSDGNETAGNAVRAAERAAGSAANGTLRIDTVPIGYAVGGETLVESVSAPARAPAGTRVPVRIELASTHGTTGTLRLFQNGSPVDIDPGRPGEGLPLALGAGRRVVVVEAELAGQRMSRFRAVFEPDPTADGFEGDSQLDNNAAEGFTLSPGSGAVLIVDDTPQGRPSAGANNLARAMAGVADRVQIIAAGALPSDLLSLQDYDLVVLNNVPADAVPAEAQAALAAHVTRVGCGLIMVGGRSSFGAGGWAGTPIEPLLPVHLDLSERMVERRTAIVFVLDRSGSMGATVGGTFRSQQAIANASAAGAAATLGARDLVGVVAFSNNAEWIVGLGENDDIAATSAAIEGITPNGGTNVLPGLELAAGALREVEAAVKHVIVLSDGRSRNAELLPEFTGAMADEGINVSTISVGDNADTESMFRMAETGGGIHYAVTNPSVLPRVFVRAVRTIRDPLIKEGEFEAVATPNAAASSVLIPVDAWPVIDGVVMTRFRDDPTALGVLATNEGDPLLAHWNAELGRVGAFTSDASEWASRWVSWQRFDAFWTRFARQMARAAGDSGYELTTEIVDDRFETRLVALDAEGDSINGLDVEASVYGPSGEAVEIRLEQVAPGEYAASVPVDEQGTYVAVVRAAGGDVVQPPIIGGATRSDAAEYRSLTPNTALLSRIAEIGGGRLLDLGRPADAQLYDRSETEPRRAETPLRPVLLVAAVALLLLDIASRRVAWDRFLQRPELAAEPGTVRVPMVERLARGSAQGDPSQTTLGEADAARVAAEARLRRRQSRDATEPAASQQSRVIEPEEPGESDVGGLLAAKRRARERYVDD